MRHPFTLSFKQRRQSPTELHGIRRALWRLRLYFEAFYEPYLPWNLAGLKPVDITNWLAVQTQAEALESSEVSNSSREAKREDIHSQDAFFSYMTVWELEEMECAWYHLEYLSSTLWRRPCPYCHDHSLPDCLLGHIRECKQHMVSGDRRLRYGCGFPEACRWFRSLLEDDIRGETTANDMAAWPGTLAREPSAGFKFLMDRHDNIDLGDIPIGIGITHGPIDELLEWGYCIWDRERLEAWCLVDSEDGRNSAVLDWWTSDGWKKRLQESRRLV